ncbi:hypothetical protein [Mucilaginibacter pedocola]|uniref:hypothetical protein n=1 Tax=Mucilaginibacter pedocola TaxID=1792845 RepID=UPI0012DEA8F5|nr:hypothetical protein [Mucilaginibacter pedocola]
MNFKVELGNTLSSSMDWFDELTEAQQQDVLEGIAEADRGEVIPHAEVVKLFAKWGLE